MHVGHEVGDVLGQHVRAPAQEGERARAFDQVDRSRAGSRRNVRYLAKSLMPKRSGSRVAATRRTAYCMSDGIDVDRGGTRAAARASCSVVATGARRRARSPVTRCDDDELLLLARIADQHLHHEAVDLRLGQRVGALGLDRVLRRHDEERLRHAVRLAGDRHLVLLHHLEQRALHLGRRAVDLVGEQQVA